MSARQAKKARKQVKQAITDGQALTDRKIKDFKDKGLFGRLSHFYGIIPTTKGKNWFLVWFVPMLLLFVPVHFAANLIKLPTAWKWAEQLYYVISNPK